MYRIAELPLEDRPRERMEILGPEALTKADLLAILISSGTQGKSALALGQELLQRWGTLQNLAEASLEELSQIKGLGKAKALKLQAAFALAKRIKLSQPNPKPQVLGPSQAMEILREPLEEKRQEHFVALLLDSKSCFMRLEKIAVGGLKGVQVHPREVFLPAIRHSAAAMIVAHNHPSGDSTPSRQDLQVTRKLVDAGRILGIPLQDHLIVGHGNHCSLRESHSELFEAKI